MSLRSFFLTILVTGFLLLVAATFFRFSRLVTIQTIACQMNGDSCPDFVIAELNKTLGKSFFFTDFEELRNHILKNTPSAQKVTLNKHFPYQIEVAIDTTQGQYIVLDSSGKSWVIDADGFTTTAEPKPEYQQVAIAQPFQFYLRETDKLPTDLHHHLETTFKILKDSFFADDTFALTSESDAQLELNDNKKALFLLQDSQQDLTQLKYFLEHYNPKDFKEPITEIDLRFGQVVVRTASTSGLIPE